AGEEVTERMARLEKDGEFAEQLFTHGLGTQVAEGMMEWLHAKVRMDLGIDLGQGRRYAWGYPACPDQSEHDKLFAVLDAPQIGLRLSGEHAIEPEQSTVAIIAHHPQAEYFSMKSGRIRDVAPSDALIKDTPADPTKIVENFEKLDTEPPDGAVESEDDPALAGNA
ncbi:MAG: methionine synthase, partial [Solirubrobacteraceae bacterium]|nr:methionine synthase [Solirubrobacteraceae bacterium]